MRPFSLAATSALVALAPSVMALPGTVALLSTPGGGCEAAVKVLKGLGVPYDLVTITSDADLKLVDSADKPLYSSTVVCHDQLLVDNGSGQFVSSLSPQGWQELESYERENGIRRVNFGVWPGPHLGVNYPHNGACCGVDEEQLLSIAPAAGDIPFHGISLGAQMSTKGLFHYPTKLLEQPAPGVSATELLRFAAKPELGFNEESTAAVISKFDDNREQMTFFFPMGDWHTGSLVLQHLWINWSLRTVYPGYRRLLLSTQVDDFYLPTPVTLNSTAPGPVESMPYPLPSYSYRTTVADLENSIQWQKQINARMSEGSDFKVELAYNGNGVILEVQPDKAIITREFENPPYSFVKPLGTGERAWPENAFFKWRQKVMKRDPLYAACLKESVKDSFYWVSHTFTHMNLNNATYEDVDKELSFNQVLTSPFYWNMVDHKNFSPRGLVNPAISGLRNGDMIRAALDNGIDGVVGDNTRPILAHPDNVHWPAVSTKDINGHDGLTIMPRFATNIYYNVTDAESAEYLYNVIYLEQFGKYSHLSDIMAEEKRRVVSQLMGLRHDSYMFHQANMRSDIPNGSLLAQWVDHIVDGVMELVNWPMVTLKHDDLVQAFRDKATRDQCGASFDLQVDNGKVVAISIKADSECTVPVTVPGDVITESDLVVEKRGADPTTVWVPMKPGVERTVTLVTPVEWK